MTYLEAVQQVSTELGLSPRVVLETYESYWKFIRETIGELPLKEHIEDEEFMKLRTNFNIPSLGKLHCTLRRYQNMKKYWKLTQERINGNNKSD